MSVVTTLASAPLRVSLAGGGTDLPSYHSRHGGLVVSIAIDHRVVVAVRPRPFAGGIRLRLEADESSPSTDGIVDPFARAAMLRSGVTGDIEICSLGDIPSGSGLGGSGAFTVALLQALGAHRGELDLTPRHLAEQASAIEMLDLGRPVGMQDHFAAAFGGAVVLEIDQRGRVEVEPLDFDDTLKTFARERLLLFFTGRRRDAGAVLGAQQNQTEIGNADTLRSLHGIRALAGDMVHAVSTGRLDDIGGLLDAHWRWKRSLSNAVSHPSIDRWYADGVAAGAQGGKLLGAGGGGFLLFAAKEGTQEGIREVMTCNGLVELPFGFESEGSQVTQLASSGEAGD